MNKSLLNKFNKSKALGYFLSFSKQCQPWMNQRPSRVWTQKEKKNSKG